MYGGGFNFSRVHTRQNNVQANNAGAAARAAQTETQMLGAEVERLLMITEALWTFIKEEKGYSDEDLARKIAEIDIRDGKLDGRVSGGEEAPKECASCGRPVGKKRAVCLYCGEPIARNPFER